MYTLPNFCRVCLKYDKNLIDLAHIENEPSETLMSKLQLCVSEVEWTTFKPLLCHPCIKRLNIAYSFKKQCVQSAGVLKNYVELVRESQKKNESQNSVKSENPVPQGGAYMLLPNQKYVKILVGSQNQGTTGNTFQNVFLNLIPTTTLTPVSNSTENSSTPKNKDTNQNVFLNINNTFQKFIPISSVDPPPLKKTESAKQTGKKAKNTSQNSNVNVNELLTESKAEEMSVEIDPTSFLSLEHDDPSSSDDDTKNDWDEVITKQKIDTKDTKVNGTTNGTGNSAGGFVPILPKDDFFSPGAGAHFLSSSFQQGDISCESCQRNFPSMRLLKQHLKQFHLGKLPFKCEYCYTELPTRSEYESCVKSHKVDHEALQNTSLTLKDFSGNSSYENDALTISLIAETPADHNLLPNEKGEYVCDVCKRIFNSSTGLLRHKVRKHHQKNRKKYFIKGMKNAKCDICNREFSTQSYMQLHRKLHLRDDVGYKYKVLGKSKYKGLPEEESEQDEQKSKDEDNDSNDKNNDGSESIDVTPDISIMQEQEDSESSSENEVETTEQPNKKRKVVPVENIKAEETDTEGNGNQEGDDEQNDEEEQNMEDQDSDSSDESNDTEDQDDKA